MINGLNETVGVVLEYLQDAKVTILIPPKVYCPCLVLIIVFYRNMDRRKEMIFLPQCVLLEGMLISSVAHSNLRVSSESV